MRHAVSEQSQSVYTIGYGARSIEAFIDVLQANEIVYLVDIRSVAYSRFKPEFSKGALESELSAHGFRYVYMGDQLGGRPGDPDCYVDGKVDYERVKTKAFYQTGIERLQRALARGVRFAIMCSEGKPETCHRSKLIGESLAALDVPILHIDENDALVDQKTVIQRLTGGQLSLFGDLTFTSRKRYDEPAPDDTEDWEDEDG